MSNCGKKAFFGENWVSNCLSEYQNRRYNIVAYLSERFENMEESNLIYYKDIESRKIDWLWYPYIPFGKITLVQGDPGEGKTTFILSLLSVLSTGGKLPCSDITVSGNAIYQNTEDDNADTIKPRLERHGADCSKICFISKENDSVSLEDDLEKWVREADAKILVLDPIQSFIGENTDMNRANSVRPRMNRLKEIAESTGCAIVLIGHLNKNAGGKANYRGLGSIDFSAAARSILIIGKPTDHSELRVMAHQKSNLGPIGQSLAFSLNDGKVEWVGHYDITADELCSMSSHEKTPTKGQSASSLLASILSLGEKSYKDILEAAENEGIGKRTLMKAKAQMNVVSVKRSGGWYWKLNDDEGDSDDNDDN